VPIEIGLTSAGWTEIASGLTGNERVVTSGTAELADGASVRVAAQ
jgi:hypothetical protein